MDEHIMSTTTKNLHWRLLLGVSLLSFTGFLNTTIISTALPDIQQRLNTPLSQLQWVMIAFFLGFGASICIMKRVSDSYHSSALVRVVRMNLLSG